MKYLKSLIKKYKEIAKDHEFVSIAEVTRDLNQALRELRIMRIPKDRR